MFIWESHELNDEQKVAVNASESILLTACPGSGKTRTLTYKIALELSKLDSDKKYIVAITYTNNAADEIKERIEILGVETSQLWIGTIHSFCLEWILKPYHHLLEKLKYGYRVTNSYESEELLTELCKDFSSPSISYWDCGTLAKSDGMYLTCTDTQKHKNIKSALSNYFSVLEERNEIDFEQILLYSHQIINEHPIVGRMLSNIFPYFMMDEYQDTKEIQYHIVSKILCNNKGSSKIMIVGDPNQSIYSSLGGYPMKKDELEGLLGFKLKKLELAKNYRSSDRVVDYFSTYKTNDSKIDAVGCHKNYKSIITYNKDVSCKNFVDEIIRLINFNIDEKNISPNEICIVAPQWVHIGSLTRQLVKRLPDYSFNGPGMAPFSRDIDNIWYKISRIILTEPSPTLFIRRIRWGNEILKHFETLGVDVTRSNPRAFLKICNSLIIDEDNGLEYLKVAFKYICEALGIDIHDYLDLEKDFEVFFESSEKRIKRLIKEGNPFVNRIEYFKRVYKVKDGITVSTIHGTKGEEYDTMIGFGLLDGYVPHFSDQNGESNSKKLLYVLCSRARKNIHLISESDRNVNCYNPNGLQPTLHLKYKSYGYDEI